MALTVYGDFTDPLSWIAALRVDAMVLSGEEVSWRAVIAHPRLTVTSLPPDGADRDRLAAVGSWHAAAALPGEPATLPNPRISPWPQPPVSAYAEAVGAGVGDDVRRLLFAAFWRHGLDIGNPDALRTLLAVPYLHGDSPWQVLSDTGYGVAINGGPVTTDAWRRIRKWRADWADLDRPELPVVLDEGELFAGFAAADRLGQLVRSRGAQVSATNPYTLPPMPVAARRLSIDRPGLRPTWWEA